MAELGIEDYLWKGGIGSAKPPVVTDRVGKSRRLHSVIDPMEESRTDRRETELDVAIDDGARVGLRAAGQRRAGASAAVVAIEGRRDAPRRRVILHHCRHRLAGSPVRWRLAGAPSGLRRIHRVTPERIRRAYGQTGCRERIRDRVVESRLGQVWIQIAGRINVRPPRVARHSPIYLRILPAEDQRPPLPRKPDIGLSAEQTATLVQRALRRSET